VKDAISSAGGQAVLGDRRSHRQALSIGFMDVGEQALGMLIRFENSLNV